MRERALIALLLIGFSLGSALAGEHAQRPMRVDDLFALEGYAANSPGSPAPVDLAPLGDAIAFTRARPDNSQKRFPIGWNAAALRSNTDVWVQIGTGEAQNLTHGEDDGTGWWSPQWSPDGKHMALLSSRNGEATLWIWSRESNQFRQLTARNVDAYRNYARPLVWVDARHILCSLLPAGTSPATIRYATQTPRLATAGWAKKVEGAVTASVLESGVPTSLNVQPQSDLVIIDIATADTRVIAAGNAREYELSPDARAVALFRPTRAFEFDPAETLNQNAAADTCELDVVDLQGRSLLAKAGTVPDAVPGSARWSPDGKRLAFLAYDGRRDRPQKLGRVDLPRARVSWSKLGELSALPVQRESTLSPPDLVWTARGDLVIALARDSDPSKPSGSRRDWWLVRRDGIQPLTLKMPSAPRKLQADARHPASLIGVAAGEVWRVDAASGEVRNLTEKVATPVLRLVSADAVPRARARTNATVAMELRAPDARYREYAVLDLDTGVFAPLAKPADSALLSAYSARGHVAVFSASDRNGTFIWRYSQHAQQSAELMAANTFLRDVAIGDLQPFEYRSLDGRPLQAWLLLPPDYQKRKRYPLFSFVYAGLVQGPEAPQSSRIDSGYAVNMQMLAAQGYAVLFPSMPLPRIGTAEEPMSSLPVGVLPAVDKAIALGFADSERLFVGGLSYGGYTTYGLITQTQRFKAALSMAGPADLISNYGTLDPGRRYAADAHLPHREGIWIPAWAESGQGAMGAPPWRDVARYVRNSPLFSVDRVQTPLMMVYGDLDMVPMQQGEEFFTGLYRQGKRAQLVFYWGEGHSVTTPANVRDLWSRIYAWLDEFGDIARDRDGAVLWDGDRVRSRHGAPALKPEEFLRFERMFAPAPPAVGPASAAAQSR